jgi:hypothetical protein
VVHNRLTTLIQRDLVHLRVRADTSAVMHGHPLRILLEEASGRVEL